MESKKSKEANIENLRVPITLIGLLFTGSIVLASFSFTDAIDKDLQANNTKSSTEIVYLEDIKKQEEPPVPIQQVDALPPIDDINIDSNTTIIPDSRIIVTPPDIVIGKDPVIISDPPVVDFPDVEAKFPGGQAAMQKWISERVQYPQTSIELNEQEKVYLSYVVEIDGSLSNITVSRGQYQDLVREAKRLVRAMPNWIPGEVKGKKVRTSCKLPINFTLD